MNISEAVSYINEHTWSQWKLGLSRTRELLERLGDPQKKLRFVHVAGSNGKGSTCAMLERILREAGYVTGLYPSPYIEDFRERIQVCGDYITEEALCRITDRVRQIADAMEDHPTQFELITAIGMLYFLEKKCDIVLLEVGLGGTYDSTNIIDPPDVAVITNIGLEHTEYLGNTLAEIAGNKCGIIKTGADVVCYENVPEVLEVVRRTCAEKGCPLRIARFDRLVPVENSLEGQTFLWKAPIEESGLAPEEAEKGAGKEAGKGAGEESWKGPGKETGETFRLSLLGEYQLHNAAVALTVIETLRARGYRIPAEAVRAGLAKVRWPARFEVLSRRPVFILDGGHNPQCAQALALSLRAYFPGGKMIFLMGMLADKDYRTVIETVAPFAAGFVCLTPDSPRALPAQELAQELRERGFAAQACPSPEQGILEALRAADLPVIAFGSLYMAGSVRRAFPAALAAFQKEQAQACRARKKEQREKALRNRRMLTEKERMEKSTVICRALKTLPALQRAHTVFSYSSVRDEVDTGEINRWMVSCGKKVCYPVIMDKEHMTAFLPDPADPGAWKTGAFGIREPLAKRSAPVPPEEVDAVLVPCAAFDRQGGRCGHGAGYYDRWLASLPAGTPKILLAFDAQETEKVALEETDIGMDIVVTESGVLVIHG